MNVTIEVTNYAYEMLKIEAERRKMTVEELCVFFLMQGCNAPSFDAKVQCTEQAGA